MAQVVKAGSQGFLNDIRTTGDAAAHGIEFDAGKSTVFLFQQQGNLYSMNTMTTGAGFLFPWPKKGSSYTYTVQRSQHDGTRPAIL